MTAETPAVAPRRDPLVLVVAGVGAFVYLLAFAKVMDSGSTEGLAPMLLFPVLPLILLPLLRRSALRHGDVFLHRILPWALAAKVMGTFGRIALITTFYGGRSDANAYHEAGIEIAEQFHRGNFDSLQSGLVGTNAMKTLTGLAYTVFGPSRYTGFMVFSTLSFLGVYMLYRAFRIAVPDGNHRRFALLLFFLPSMLFWPSSIGKEAWMIFAIGLSSYGLARILAHQPIGYAITALGLVATAILRPHITLAVFVSLGVAYVLRRPSARVTPLAPITKTIGVLAIALGGVVVLAQVASFFEIESLNPQTVSTVLGETAERTDEADSAFGGARPSKPLDYPAAAASVLFRPFPFEARNPQALMTALEGTFVMFWLLGAVRLRAVGRAVVRTPYVAYALSFLGLFIFAFSSFGNFGILARQRVQVLPFLVVLLCLPAVQVVKAEPRPAKSAPLGPDPRWPQPVGGAARR